MDVLCSVFKMILIWKFFFLGYVMWLSVLGLFFREEWGNKVVELRISEVLRVKIYFSYFMYKKNGWIRGFGLYLCFFIKVWGKIV